MYRLLQFAVFINLAYLRLKYLFSAYKYQFMYFGAHLIILNLDFPSSVSVHLQGISVTLKVKVHAGN